MLLRKGRAHKKTNVEHWIEHKAIICNGEVNATMYAILCNAIGLQSMHCRHFESAFGVCVFGRVHFVLSIDISLMINSSEQKHTFHFAMFHNTNSHTHTYTHKRNRALFIRPNEMNDEIKNRSISLSRHEIIVCEPKLIKRHIRQINWRMGKLRFKIKYYSDWLF